MVRENESFGGPLGIRCQERCRRPRFTGVRKCLWKLQGRGNRSRQAEPSDYSAGLTPVKGEGDWIGQRLKLN